MSPITAAELKANPAEATQKAAQFTHAKAVDLANWVPGANVDPFSKVGIVTGAGVESAKKVGIHEGVQSASEAAESQIDKRMR